MGPASANAPARPIDQRDMGFSAALKRQAVRTARRTKLRRRERRLSSLERVRTQAMGGRRSGDGRSVANGTEPEGDSKRCDGAAGSVTGAEGIAVTTRPPAQQTPGSM